MYKLSPSFFFSFLNFYLFVSHTVHPMHTGRSGSQDRRPVPCHLTSSPDLSSIAPQKNAALPGTSIEHGTARHNKTRRKPSHQSWARQPSRMKRVLTAGKRFRNTLHSHCQEFPRNHQANNHTIYTEDLAQTHTHSVIVALVSVSLHEPC